MTDGPGRSLAAIEYLPPEQDGDLRVLLTCDCATMTDLTIRHLVPGGAAAEVAVTCDGCGTTYWFTVSATGGQVVHACPPDGSPVTSCCDRTPFELPPTDRMTQDPALVTCGGEGARP